MANISNYLEEALLNHVFRNTEYVRPTTVYCALVDSTAVDTDVEAGTLTNEITTYDEATRPAITFSAPVQDGGKATIKNNDGVGGGEIEFTVMPAVTVKYACVMDSATKGAGNILYWNPLSPAKTTNAGDTFRIPIDSLVQDLD